MSDLYAGDALADPPVHRPEPCVADVLTAQILECPVQTSIRHAAQQMKAAACSAIIVTDKGQAVGIWTEHDALRLDLRQAATLEQPIQTVMSSPVRRPAS